MKPLNLLVILLLANSAVMAAEEAEVDDGFEPLFGTNLDNWSQLNTNLPSFIFDGGVLQVTGDGGWLSSPRNYADFELRGQVLFLGQDADSGIFLRVEPGTDFINGWPGDAYQVQMRDITANKTDNPLPLVNIYRHEVADGETDYQRDKVFELYTGPGEWQMFTIRAIGSTITVELNGEVVTTAEGIENPTGRIGIQSEAGFILYRGLEIHEL
jgi:hypothetical protein